MDKYLLEQHASVACGHSIDYGAMEAENRAMSARVHERSLWEVRNIPLTIAIELNSLDFCTWEFSREFL